MSRKRPRASRPSGQCHIARLPTEILLAIALHIPRNSHLCQLALVNKRFRTIAREALFRQLIIPADGRTALPLFKLLLSTPATANSVRTIDLGEFERYIDQSQPSTWMAKTIFKFGQTISAMGKSPADDIFLLAELNTPYTFWSCDTQIALALLAIVSSKLTELILELPGTDVWLWEVSLLLPGNIYSQRTTPLFLEPVSGLLKDKLQSLTITEDSYWKKHSFYVLDFSFFTKLEKLRVPVDVLIQPPRVIETATDDPNPLEVLPGSLMCLQIRGYNTYVGTWIRQVTQTYPSPEVFKLRRIEFHWATRLQNALVLAYYDQEGQIGVLYELLDSLSKEGLDIVAFAVDAHSPKSFRDEAEACSYLSEAEAALAATMKIPFSKAVSRNSDGAPRRRSAIERRFWFRHVSDASRSSSLFPNLSPYYGDSRSVRAYKGIKTPFWSEQSQGRAGSGLDLKSSVQCGCNLVEQREIPPPYLFQPSDPFDAEIWKNETFFGDVEAPAVRRTCERCLLNKRYRCLDLSHPMMITKSLPRQKQRRWISDHEVLKSVSTFSLQVHEPTQVVQQAPQQPPTSARQDPVEVITQMLQKF